MARFVKEKRVVGDLTAGAAGWRHRAAAGLRTPSVSTGSTSSRTTAARRSRRERSKGRWGRSRNPNIEGSVIVNDARNLRRSQGLDAIASEIVDLVAAGVIDAATVTRSALQNAGSIAKKHLTTEVIVAEVREKESGGGGDGTPHISPMK